MTKHKPIAFQQRSTSRMPSPITKYGSFKELRNNNTASLMGEELA
jgi:hypothetical protein